MTVDEVRNIIKDYATNPPWIPVTYLNGWVDYSTTRTSAYYKDIWGYVHLRVNCKNGTTAYPFVMPEGYRPEQLLTKPIASIQTSNNPPRFDLNIDGVLMFFDYTNSYCLNSLIIYRAS